jgi:hypothetical protein
MDHKDVQIGESSYRIGRMKAADGSWIATTFAKRYREYREANPFPESDPNAEPTTPVPAELGYMLSAQFLAEQLSRTEYTEMQTLCLSVCGRYSNKTGSPLSLPILLPNGAWAIPELEYDGPTILQLTKETLAFNIAPFFPGAGSVGTTPATDSSQPSSQT